MDQSDRGLPLIEALALGVLQGTTELVPVSSSGHIVLIPALLGWRFPQLDPSERKTLEVAVHAGAAIGIGWALRDEARREIAEASPARIGRVALTLLPAALAGLVLEGPIERRLGSPRAVALAQIVGGAALLTADRASTDRGFNQERLVDAAVLGGAQALALAPGVSRYGAVVTAARMRRFDRSAAERLARAAALPVIAGATALKGTRLRRGDLPSSLRASLAVAAVAAGVSAIVVARIAGARDRPKSYAPHAVYRMALGALALRRLPSS